MSKSKLYLALAAVGVMGLAAAEPAPAAKQEAKKPEVKAEAKKAEPAKVDVWAALPDVVAEIDGKSVKKDEVVAVFMEQLPNGEVPAFLTPDMVKQLAPSLVEAVVRMKLIDADMQKQGFQASPEKIREFLKAEIQKAPKEQLDFMTKQLAMQGKTLDQHIDGIVANPAHRKGIAKFMFARQTFLKDAKATESEAKAFYDKNPDKFKIPADGKDTVRASHILVLVDEKATEAVRKAAEDKIAKIAAELKAHPEKFAEIAKAESACPSKEQGGSLGAFTKGQMVPEFEKAAFALKEGEISGVVKTKYGYHIIRRDASQKESMVPFDQVKAEIMEMLEGQKAKEAEEKYIAALEKANNVKVFVKPAKAEAAPAPAPAPAPAKK